MLGSPTFEVFIAQMHIPATRIYIFVTQDERRAKRARLERDRYAAAKDVRDALERYFEQQHQLWSSQIASIEVSESEATEIRRDFLTFWLGDRPPSVWLTERLRRGEPPEISRSYLQDGFSPPGIGSRQENDVNVLLCT